MIHLIKKIKDEIKKDLLGFIIKLIAIIFCSFLIVHLIDLSYRLYEKI